MPKAVKLTEENIPYLTHFASKLHSTLHLHEAMDEGTDAGTDVYLIMDGTPEYEPVAFSTMWKDEFFHSWKFENPQEWIYGFTRIVKL